MLQIPPRIPEIHAPIFDEIYLKGARKYRHQAGKDFKTVAKQLVQKMNLPRGAVAIELACGIGTLAYLVAEEVPENRIVGIDIDPIAVENAKTFYQHQNLEFRVADVYALNTDELSPSAVFCFHSVHHFDRLDDALVQINAILPRDGYIHIQDLSRASLILPRSPKMFQQVYSMRKSNSDEECMNLFRQRGWLSGQNANELVVAMSCGAAYTPQEVIRALQRTGFNKITLSEDCSSSLMTIYTVRAYKK